MNDMTVIQRPAVSAKAEARALSVEDLTEREGEPRIRDVDLAERLGFRLAYDVRKTIDRNRKELQSYGEVFATVAKTSEGGGRPGKEYWLNEGQALVICALSRTSKAAAIRKQIIDVFMAYRAGRLAPSTIADSVPADQSALSGSALEELDAKISGIAILVAGLQRQLGKNPALRLEEPHPAETDASRAATMPAGASANRRKGRGKLAEPAGPDLLYGMPAIAAYLQLRRGQAYHLAEKGGMPTFRLGRIVCAMRAAIDAWVLAAASHAGDRS